MKGLSFDGFGKREDGYALPLALITLFIFTLYVSVFLGILSHEKLENNQLLGTWQAKYAAESGVEDALYNMKLAIEQTSDPSIDYSTINFAASAAAGGPTFLPGDGLNLLSKPSIAPDIRSSGFGNLVDSNSNYVAKYNWVIRGSFQTTPPFANELTHNMTIQSVGTYQAPTFDPATGGHDTYTVRVQVGVEVNFVPWMTPNNSPINVLTTSYQTIGTKFDWEQ